MESSEKAKRRKIPPAVTCGYRNTNASRDFYVSNFKKKKKKKKTSSVPADGAHKKSEEKKQRLNRMLGQTRSSVPIAQFSCALVSGSGVSG